MLKKILLLFCILLPTMSFAGKISLEIESPFSSGYPALIIAGQEITVSINADSLNDEIGGFRFVLALDETKYAFINLTQGAYLDSCDWEYIIWQKHYDEDLSYSIAPATALLEINGLASLNGTVPSCAISSTKKELVQVQLESTVQHIGSWDYEMVFLNFYWRDCQDNLLYSKNLDSAYTGSTVFNPIIYSDSAQELITSFPGYGLEGATCDTVSEYRSIANLQVINGGYEAVYDHFEWNRGDLNVNGVRYEISDIVLYVNYFLNGIMTFAPWPLEASITASDFNADGLYLSMSDLVYGIQVLIEDVSAYTKRVSNPEPYNANLIASDNNLELSLNSTNALDAVYLKFVTDDNQILTANDFTYLNKSVEFGSIGDTTTLLMVNIDGSSVLEAGENKLLESVHANYRVTYFEAVDIYGQTSYNYKLAELPQSFELFQNYPNPFNPSTVIKVNLPKQTDYSFEIISIIGQTVRTFKGTAQGLLQIEWDGKDALGNSSASGIYLYRFNADGLTDSKKMLLLK